MKKTLALIAALTFAVTAFASCGKTDDDSSSKEKSNKETTSSVADESKADEESKADAESTADSETASADSETASADADSSKSGDASTTADSAAADSKASDSKSAETSSADESRLTESDSDIDFSGLYSEVEQPSSDPVNAEQSKFLGKWECYCMAADGLAYDSVFGIPLYASLRFEIKDGGKGIVSSLDDFETGSTADEDFTWEFADNKITIYSSSDTTYGYFNSDGYLVLYSESDPEMFMYFKSVKEYTPFDASDLEDVFGDLGGTEE